MLSDVESDVVDTALMADSQEELRQVLEEFG